MSNVIQKISNAVDNTAQLRASLRVPYTFPGGYEIVGFTSDRTIAADEPTDER